MFIARECTFPRGQCGKTIQEGRDGNRTRHAGSRVQRLRPLGFSFLIDVQLHRVIMMKARAGTWRVGDGDGVGVVVVGPAFEEEFLARLGLRK